MKEGGLSRLETVEPADAGSDVNAHALIVFRSDFQLRHFERFIGGGKRQVNETSHFFDFFFFDEVERIEVLDLGGDLAGEITGVELRDAGNAPLAGEHGLPHLSGGISHAANQADAGNYDPASQTTCRLSNAWRCNRWRPARCGFFPRPRREFRCRSLLRKPLRVRLCPASPRPDRPRMTHWRGPRTRPRPTVLR